MATASEILTAWRRVAAAFGGRPTLWLKMLMVAEAGERGVKVNNLLGGGGNRRWRRARAQCFKTAEQQGLVTVETIRPECGNGRSYRLLRITPKGMRVLGGDTHSTAHAGDDPGIERGV